VDKGEDYELNEKRIHFTLNQITANTVTQELAKRIGT